MTGAVWKQHLQTKVKLRHLLVEVSGGHRGAGLLPKLISTEDPVLNQ